MAVPWPTAFPAYVEDWRENELPVVIRTATETGPVKVRRRFTRARRVVSVQMIFTSAQYVSFQTWFRDVLLGGVQEFDFVNPYTQTTVSYRFVEPPVASPLGAFNVRLAMSWETV